jgi:predicted esterase
LRNADVLPASESISDASVTAHDRPTERFTIQDDQGRPIEVYPPISKESRSPFVVLLHATCMQPAWVCDWVGDAGRDIGWLVCPSGNSTCAGEPDWHGSGPEKAAFLENALTKVQTSVPAFIDDQPGVLIGWSRGAFAARDILYASLSDPKLSPLAKRFRGLVLMAASVTPDISKLQRAGITRVVMAAGDYDGAKRTMELAVATLRAAGLEARYVSLGKIAHVWPNDFEARMREPIAWAGHARLTP